MKISQKEIIINTSLGETSKIFSISLTKRPSKFRSRKLINTDTNKISKARESNYFFNTEGLSGQVVSSEDGEIRYEYDEISSDSSSAEVEIIIENPNPALFNISPTVLTFNSQNYSLPQQVEITLNSRRYACEYYSDVKILTSSSVDQFYENNEFYFDISVLVAERRNSFFKTAEANEVFSMPSNKFSLKRLKLKKLRIVGCFFNFILYPEDTISFGEKAYKKQDLLQYIAQLNGVDPALVQIPGEYPEFSPLTSSPFQPAAYRCIGIDGRVMSGSGATTFNSALLSSFPTTIELVISDLYKKIIPLSSFAVVDTPNISGFNIGPLSAAVLEFDLNDEILECDQFIRVMPNGDTSLYYYGVVSGGSQSVYVDGLDGVFNEGLTMARPFQLQLEAEITGNALEAQTDSITHFVSLKKESSQLKPIFSDYSNEVEIFPYGVSSNGVSSIIKLRRNNNDLTKHREYFNLRNSNEVVWWNKSTNNFEASIEITSTLENSEDLSLFYSSNSSIGDASLVDFANPAFITLFPFYSELSSQIVHNKFEESSQDESQNQFIIPRELYAAATPNLSQAERELEPVVFDLALINKYGFVAGII